MTFRWCAAVLLCLLIAACRADGAPLPTATEEQAPVNPPQHTLEPSSTPLSTEPSATSTLAPLPLASPLPTPEPSTATPLPEPDSWHAAGTRLLFVSGDDEQADLFALGDDGTVWQLFPDVGRAARVSPDGRWLGFVRWHDGGRSTLELHQTQSGEVREITPDTTSGLFQFAFDSDGSRLAFINLGVYSDAGVPWDLVVVDLESGATARYDALMAGPETRPLPGMPVGWSAQTSPGDELIIDTFLPYTEGGWMGVWGVTLPENGASAPLDSLIVRELIPGAPAYSSRLRLAPDSRDVAYLGRDLDYVPDNYVSEFYDLAVNRLSFTALGDGVTTMVVEVDDGSALARAFSWSPTGERLLFAQGHYEGENWADLTLKSSDRSGTIVTYGPLTVPALGGLSDLVWCDPSQVFYVTWDGSGGPEHLVGFDLNTGISSEISAGRRVEIVGCAPE